GAQVAEANPRLGRLPIHREAGAVIVDTQAEMAASTRTCHPHSPSSHAFGDAVLYGILHEWLQQQIWNQRTQQFAGNFDAYPQTVAKTDLLNVQVALQILDFLLQRHLRPVGILRGAS